ncbi:uncharacterized protein LOC119975278 isoform X1 [Scyliorhinus canicula]|uniref:uncharacterized protein LOC119975278 isoform X1 n=1 Tax=Scyliorhinus canicula TaxID=7830 RepID=UPI0018F38179|nr:uncharacterized protein LOC119975278 isoform X1 [Scyliorhinus canicula]
MTAKLTWTPLPHIIHPAELFKRLSLGSACSFPALRLTYHLSGGKKQLVVPMQHDDDLPTSQSVSLGNRAHPVMSYSHPQHFWGLHSFYNYRAFKRSKSYASGTTLKHEKRHIRLFSDSRNWFDLCRSFCYNWNMHRADPLFELSMLMQEEFFWIFVRKYATETSGEGRKETTKG